MWPLILLHLGLHRAYALPAAQSSDSCIYDDLYTSLYEDGQEFCSSMINTDCDDDYGTPTQFAIYPETQLSSYCECVLTSCDWEETSTTDGTPTETGTGTDWITATSTTASLTSTASESMITSTPGASPSSGQASETSKHTNTSTSDGDATSANTQTVPTSTNSNSDSTTATGSSETSSALVSTAISSSETTATNTDDGSSTATATTEASSTARSGTSSTETSSAAATSSATSDGSTVKSTSSAFKTSWRNSDLTSAIPVFPSDPLTSTLTDPKSTTETSTDTGSVTGKTDTVFTSTTTSEASGITSTSGTTTHDGGFTSGPSDGEPNPTKTSTRTSTGTEDSSSTFITSSSSARATTVDGGNSTTSAKGYESSTMTTKPWSSGLASSIISASSWVLTSSVVLSPTGTGATTTGPLTSEQPTPTFSGWNSSSTDTSWASGSVTVSISGTGTVTGTITIPGTEIGTVTQRPSSVNSSATTPMSSYAGTGGISTPTTSRSFPGTAGSSTWPTSPPFLTPSGFNTSIHTRTSLGTPTTFASFPAANFTQVTRTGAIVRETCYQLPQPTSGSTWRALLHNTELREKNATIPFPYIESVDFHDDGIDPLFLTLRDAAEGTHYIDVSNRSHIAIVDSLYNAMVLDARGIHFSTKKCRYDVSITIDKMYEQLAKLSGQVCSANAKAMGTDDQEFQQAIYIRDQCNNPVRRTVRKWPLLKVGDTDCNNLEVDEATGRWLFDCTFPGSDSGVQRCQRAIRNDVEKFLFTDPFGGSCPDLSTVITTLEATGQDFINPESLRAELYKQGLDAAQKGEADLTVVYYEQLWEILKQAFSKLRTATSGRLSAISEYIDVYNQYRNFEDDICADIHAGDMPLKMSLRAGVSYIDTVAKLSWVPQNPTPYNVTIQDPSKEACCANGATSVTDDKTGMCLYPPSSHIGSTGCVCGTTVSGASIAFEFTECENFVSECKVDADCAKAGHASYVCLTGSCCGAGVCINPYECSQNGTGLVGAAF